MRQDCVAIPPSNYREVLGMVGLSFRFLKNARLFKLLMGGGTVT